MLKIRLQRVGRKHEPIFRVVLTDSKNSTKSGRLKEVLGSYDPRKTVDLLKVDRIKYWLDKGALPTGTTHNLFVSHKIIDSKKINVLPRKTPKQSAKAEAPTETVAPSTEATEGQSSTSEAVVESTEASA